MLGVSSLLQPVQATLLTLLLTSPLTASAKPYWGRIPCQGQTKEEFKVVIGYFSILFPYTKRIISRVRFYTKRCEVTDYTCWQKNGDTNTRVDARKLLQHIKHQIVSFYQNSFSTKWNGVQWLPFTFFMKIYENCVKYLSTNLLIRAIQDSEKRKKEKKYVVLFCFFNHSRDTTRYASKNKHIKSIKKESLSQ